MSVEWREIQASASDFRRSLHRQPELTWQEHGTARSIRERLTALGINWRECAATGTVAFIGDDPSRETVALRGDIDALPVQEDSGVEWASVTEGCMHACGHDGHTATLLATAGWLARAGELPVNVRLLFQPAEEGGHGAREMIKGGALDGVDRIFGWHNWPAIGFGRMLCPDGIVMAGNGTFEITLTSDGGHASQPEATGDTVLAASAVTLALQQIVSRRLSPHQQVVVSVTSIDARSQPTIIPGRVTLGGSIRVPSKAARDEVNTLIGDISRATAAAWGVSVDVMIHPRYEATINHPPAAAQMRDAWQRLYGGDMLDAGMPAPVMASEDFSYYLAEVPGAFALIGADDGERCHRVPCHSPAYDFNDRLIPRVTALYALLVGAEAPASHT